MEDILRYAEKSGCDWDGDIVLFGEKHIMLDISRRIVEEVKR